MSGEGYATLSCPQVGQQLQRSLAELSRVAALQNNKADTDALWAMLIGIPPGKFTGNYEADVARLKDEVDAQQAIQAARPCNVP